MILLLLSVFAAFTFGTITAAHVFLCNVNLCIDTAMSFVYNEIRCFVVMMYGRVPERPKGADCKSVVSDFGGSNPPSPTNIKTLRASMLQGSFLLAELKHGGN